MAKRTAKGHWDALDEATLDAVIESELAMTPEQRRKALVEEGHDIDALHSKADAFFASRTKKAAAAPSPAGAPSATSPGEAPKEPSASKPSQPLAPVVPIRAKKAWTPWLAAAAAAVVGGGIGINAMLTPDPVGHAPPTKADAAALRDAARIDCDMKRWALCRERLDEADREDHEGEGEPRVVKMRAAIEAGVAPGAVDGH